MNQIIAVPTATTLLTAFQPAVTPPAESWKVVPGFELYEASDLGRIRRKENKRVLSPYLSKGGGGTNVSHRHEVNLAIYGDLNTKLVHRVIAMTWLPDYGEDCTILHINGDKLDNRLENLQVVTQLENTREAFKIGKINTPLPTAKLHPQTGRILEIYHGRRDASRSIGRSETAIHQAIKTGGKSGGYRWRNPTKLEIKIHGINEWTGPPKGVSTVNTLRST